MTWGNAPRGTSAQLPPRGLNAARRLSGENLYGVDVMPWACKVAELRLWLALIIETEISTAETADSRDEPLLPDFSFNIRHGDSLVQDIGGMNLAQTRALGSGVPSDIKRAK